MNYGNMMQRHFLPALEKAKMPVMRFHDLRHTYASLLIEQGENLKYIQTQMGHSSPTVTLNVYAHLMKPTNQEAAARLEKAVFQESRFLQRWKFDDLGAVRSLEHAKLSSCSRRSLLL
jgi:integrase